MAEKTMTGKTLFISGGTRGIGKAIVYEFASKEVKDLKLEELEKDKEYLEMQVKSEMTKIWWDNNAFYEARLLNDNQFKRALEAIPQAKIFLKDE